MPRSRRKPLPTVLVFGFEPFAGDEINPAMDLLRDLDDRVVHGHRITTVLLPVAFAAALSAVAHALERDPPVLALGLGLAGGRARLSLERVALNLIDARIADNDGAQPVDVAVIAGAPDAYLSTLPQKAMLRELVARGIPAELSLSAGTFVCNAVFFALRHFAATRWPAMRAGFIHVPWLPQQAACHAGGASLSLQTMHDGILVALDVALRTPVDLPVPAGTIC